MATEKLTLNIETSEILAHLRDQFTASERVVIDILEERARQDEQWGGPEHDDTHTGNDWLGFIGKQQLTAVNETLSDNGLEVVDPEHYRERLVKIAALAIAAIESHDRLQGPTEVADEPGDETPVTLTRDMLLSYLTDALPDRPAIREFEITYWVEIGKDRAGEEELAQAIRATREHDALFGPAAVATVSIEHPETAITTRAEAR